MVPSSRCKRPASTHRLDQPERLVSHPSWVIYPCDGDLACPTSSRDSGSWGGGFALHCRRAAAKRHSSKGIKIMVSCDSASSFRHGLGDRRTAEAEASGFMRRRRPCSALATCRADSLTGECLQNVFALLIQKRPVDADVMWFAGLAEHKLAAAGGGGGGSAILRASACSTSSSSFSSLTRLAFSSSVGSGLALGRATTSWSLTPRSESVEHPLPWRPPEYRPVRERPPGSRSGSGAISPRNG